MTFELAGYAAATLVFAAFYMRHMVALRIVAICSNIAFLIYAFGLGLTPVAILHLGLIPVNGWRLYEALAHRPARAGNRADPGRSPRRIGSRAIPNGSCS